ncbi:MAG: Asp-tRNA(Asn)/Glu-tRNA(Gln) amidotransferase subunit GatC [Terriglobales bacterium]
MNLDAIAQLAHLELSPEEAAALERDLDAILAYIEQLKQIDVTGVEPMSHPLVAGSPLRDDCARPGFTRADALANAPAQRDGFFEVPGILG